MCHGLQDIDWSVFSDTERVRYETVSNLFTKGETALPKSVLIELNKKYATTENNRKRKLQEHNNA